jgi:hypothetical protein
MLISIGFIIYAIIKKEYHPVQTVKNKFVKKKLLWLFACLLSIIFILGAFYSLVKLGNKEAIYQLAFYCVTSLFLLTV